jgi:hypothetical protein
VCIGVWIETPASFAYGMYRTCGGSNAWCLVECMVSSQVHGVKASSGSMWSPAELQSGTPQFYDMRHGCLGLMAAAKQLSRIFY